MQDELVFGWYLVGFSSLFLGAVGGGACSQVLVRLNYAAEGVFKAKLTLHNSLSHPSPGHMIM